MKTLSLCIVFSIVASFSPCSAKDFLMPAATVELTGTHGKFDFIKVDATRRRLLACHTGNSSLDIIDLNNSKLVKSIPTGAAQGVAIDDKGGRYLVSCSKPPKLVIVDSTKLEVIGEVSLPSSADLCAYDPAINRVFVDNDEKPEMWVIDPDAKKILKTITLPGNGMEDLAFNADGSILYQNLKGASQLVRIDPKSGKILDAFPTSPASQPHGLAMVLDANAVLVAGDGKLAMMNLLNGKVLVTSDIAQKVDEIAYDPNLARAYAASGTGVISIAFAGPASLTTIGSAPSAPGAHSIAVDPQTHTVWIAYAKGDIPCVQSFSAVP